MARPATGTIIEKRNAAGTLTRSIRFAVNGRKRSIALGEVTRAEAEERLQHELADVARGTWTPPAAPVAVPEVPTFHEYAEQWWTLNESQFADKTRTDYRWRLEKHLLGYFGEMPLDQIKPVTVERYIAGKVAEGVLSPRSVNMTLVLLAAILERAVEHELIGRNPARGRGRRVRERAPRRSYLETAEQIETLLDAAGELDRLATRERQHVHRRAMLAVLTFAGLRIGELCALRWRDVDLAGGWLQVRDAKTDAGRRKVKIRGALRDELLSVRADRHAGPDAYVFATRSGGRMSTDNVRKRVLGGAVTLANATLAEHGLMPLPEGLTPHSLRRTFATVLYALGETPPVVMAEMGHQQEGLALRVYAQVMRLDEAERERLRALVEGEFRHSMDTNGVFEGSEAVERKAA